MLLEALSLMFGMEPQVDILKSQLAAQLIKNCEISAGPTFQNFYPWLCTQRQCFES